MQTANGRALITRTLRTNSHMEAPTVTIPSWGFRHGETGSGRARTRELASARKDRAPRIRKLLRNSLLIVLGRHNKDLPKQKDLSYRNCLGKRRLCPGLGLLLKCRLSLQCLESQYQAQQDGTELPRHQEQEGCLMQGLRRILAVSVCFGIIIYYPTGTTLEALGKPT